MNGIAEALTGWTNGDANGRPLADVFHIVNETTRQPVDNPAGLVIRSGHVVGLANHTVLINRDGTERPITDSAAHNPRRSTDGFSGSSSRSGTSPNSAGPKRRSQSNANGLRRRLKAWGTRSSPTDVRGQIVFMNPVAEHLTGWTTEQARDARAQTSSGSSTKTPASG